jgi:FtsZ-binding cell division protein ZapB
VSGFEDLTDRADFAEMRMGRMDGDGIAMGNEYSAVESQHDEIRRLRVELQSLKDANDRLQDERDALQHQVEHLLEGRREGGLEFDALSRQRDALQREVDRLRHQSGEARQQPAVQATRFAENVLKLRAENAELRREIERWQTAIRQVVTLI